MSSTYLVILLSVFLFTTNGTANASVENINLVANDQGVDDSMIFDELQKNLGALPLQGVVSKPENFWSGDYWAINQGSINKRWNSDSEKGFNLSSPSMDQARNMSIDELSELAPTEKYDLFTGNYNYPLKREVNAIVNKDAKDWEGICHGWAPASMNHKEPTPKTVANPDGIQIPFGSSDIKALISYYYAFGFNVEDTYQMGSRCEGRGFLGISFRKECRKDLNPGTFHIVLANRIALQGKGFIADVDRFDEVWNHPIHSYKSEIMKSNDSVLDSPATPDSKKRVKIKTTMYYIDESRVNTWETLVGTREQRILDKTYTYSLDLNDNNEIVGGKWLSKDRPDFLWIKHRPHQFEGLLYRLGELLND